MKLLVALLGAAALLFLTPERLFAFGPATHIFLGEQLLGSLYLLPAGIADLLRAYPLSFLYGSVAADISFAKKYVPAGRHCHYWHVGEEILSGARNDRLKAAGYGYLCHLAADTIAHNYFVPRQLMLTSSTKALGHSYWEHRLDVELGEGYTGRAREVVVEYDHSEADNLFDSVLSGTIFSFETNRRLFRGMVRFQDNDRWQNVFGRVLGRSRWDLQGTDVDGYLSRSFDSMVDYLLRRRASPAAARDPTGDFNLQLAKKVRRMALREGSAEEEVRMRELADDFFPLPEDGLDYWTRRGDEPDPGGIAPGSSSASSASSTG
ncbi:MAG TPA: zinc dependent phospholipase C family protein [Longimicrobiales bacterium]|nr:zinc dependent phospholipase C family protein [Longimicrobiales bacterium]